MNNKPRVFLSHVFSPTVERQSVVDTFIEIDAEGKCFLIAKVAGEHGAHSPLYSYRVQVGRVA